MMVLRHILILLLCLATVTVANAERARYDNYRVYKANPNTAKELEFMQQMERSSDSVLFLEGVHLVNKSVEVVVAPHKLPDFLRALDDNEIDYEMLAENLQAHLDEEKKVNNDKLQGRATGYNWEAYQKLDDTYNWLTKMSSSYPNYVTLIEGGKTYEKRSILGLKISDKSVKGQKPGIFVEGGIHAREWISPAVVTYFINELLTSEDPAIKELAQSYDWYIFPHVNPDGFVYTHTTDRLWRKTRQPYGPCYGADPNRNWDFHWGEIGASNDPCDLMYAGPKAFSEIETKSLADYIKSLKGKIQLYLSFHSYAQYVLYPYGHTDVLPDNIEDYKQVFDVAVAALGKRYGTKYTGGTTYEALYPATGTSTDWVYGALNVRMSFCVEMRPKSDGLWIEGFALPAEQIIPTSEETVDGVIAIVNKVKDLGYFKLNT